MITTNFFPYVSFTPFMPLDVASSVILFCQVHFFPHFGHRYIFLQSKEIRLGDKSGGSIIIVYSTNFPPTESAIFSFCCHLNSDHLNPIMFYTSWTIIHSLIFLQYNFLLPLQTSKIIQYKTMVYCCKFYHNLLQILPQKTIFT